MDFRTTNAVKFTEEDSQALNMVLLERVGMTSRESVEVTLNEV